MNATSTAAPLILATSMLLGLPGGACGQAAPAPEPATKDAEKAKLDTTSPSFFRGWTGSVELGLNGAEGNTERLSFRAGASATRKRELMETKLSTVYAYAKENSVNTQNRFELNARNDWIFSKGSRWRYFLQGTFEYDELQDWKERVSIGNGVGYQFIKTDRTSLLGRVGLGASKKLHGDDTVWRLEGILGADLEHKLTERQKLTASIDVFPSLSPIGPYRSVAKAAWEIIIDPEVKLSLKVGAEDRYDSRPGPGKKRNDVDYFALLVWSF